MTLDERIDAHVHAFQPPVSPMWAIAAREAVRLINAGEWEAELYLPNGKYGRAIEVVAALQLDEFLDMFQGPQQSIGEMFAGAVEV